MWELLELQTHRLCLTPIYSCIKCYREFGSLYQHVFTASHFLGTGDQAQLSWVP